MNVPGGSVVRTFIAGDMLCDDGDSIVRVQEAEGCLETRYACPRSHRHLSIQGFGGISMKTAETVGNYPMTTTCLALGFGSGMLCRYLCLLTALAGIEEMGDTSYVEFVTTK